MNSHLKTTFQLSNPGINKSYNFDELHMQEKKCEGGKEHAIREIKWCVYCHASCPLVRCKMWWASRKTNTMFWQMVWLLSAASIKIFLVAGLQNCFALSWGKSASLLQEPVSSRELLLMIYGFSLQAICSTLGGHFTLMHWCLLPTPTVSNIATQWRWGCFYLSLTGSVVSLSWLRHPTPFLPLLNHTHCLRERQTHACHTVSPALPRFSQLIVKLWFSRAGWSSHPSSPFWRMSCLKNKTNKFSTKGWRGCLQFLTLPTDTDTFGTHKKDPFLNHLICIFHGSRSTCSISGHLISCHPLYIHY